MTDLYMGPQPLINFSALDAELRAALPGKLDGIRNAAKTGDLWVIVTEGHDAESLRGPVAAVIAAHNSAVLTPTQEAEAAKAAAVDALATADLAGMVNAVHDAKTLQDVRPLLLTALALLGKLAVAQGFIPAAQLRAADEAIAARPVALVEG
jgi:hypothetical protein